MSLVKCRVTVANKKIGWYNNIVTVTMGLRKGHGPSYYYINTYQHMAHEMISRFYLHEFNKANFIVLLSGKTKPTIS